MIRMVLEMGETRITLVSVSSPDLKRGNKIQGSLNFHRSKVPREVRPKPKKDNGSEMQRPRKDCAMCGGAHSGECTHDTNSYFGCSKSSHMVKDCPQKIN